jgi:hypothetical protein
LLFFLLKRRWAKRVWVVKRVDFGGELFLS